MLMSKATSFRRLLGEHGIVELGDDETYSVGRKWRSALNKLGFLYPEVPTSVGVPQNEVGSLDMITSNGWRLIRAETVPAIQECFLRALADGSKVDTVWEATIGNMGRTIYVFEVQTRGSIDSLLMNLLKSLNNPAVQGIVAVSDAAQIEKIKKHAASIPLLGAKLRFWDYLDVLRVHESLALVNESINSLGLVPEGF